MVFDKLPLAAMMAKKMAWLTRRSEVLAQNIANSNTPGYKARDLQETSFRRLVARELGGAQGAAQPRMTHLAHMSGPSRTQAAYRVEDESDVPEIDISGNTVSMAQQMQQLGETQLSYQMVVDLYRKHLGMFRTALGRNG